MGTQHIKKVALTAICGLALLGLGACSNGGGSNSGNNGGGAITPTQPASPQASISASFAALFNAAANSDPREPVAGDLPPLSLTTDPVNVF